MIDLVPFIRLLSDLVQKLLGGIKNLIGLLVSALFIQDVICDAWDSLALVKGELVWS